MCICSAFWANHQWRHKEESKEILLWVMWGCFVMRWEWWIINSLQDVQRKQSTWKSWSRATQRDFSPITDLPHLTHIPTHTVTDTQSQTKSQTHRQRQSHRHTDRDTVTETHRLVLVHVQVLVLDLSSPTSLRFGLGTFFGSDSVHALMFLFISYKPHFASAAEEESNWRYC